VCEIDVETLEVQKKLNEAKDRINPRTFYKVANRYDFSDVLKWYLIDNGVLDIKPTNGYLKMNEMLGLYVGGVVRELRTFHIAEFPGEFIKATIAYCRRKNISLDWHGQSLMPSVDSTALKEDEYLFGKFRDRWLMSKEMDGNLMNPEVLKWYKKYFSDEKRKVDLATADGGMDVSGNYNEQERAHFKLFAGEIHVALSALKVGGTFILKIYQIVYPLTATYCILLSAIFDSVEILKPETSRFRNDEKYLICRGLKGSIGDIHNFFMKIVRGVKEYDCFIPNFDVSENMEIIRKYEIEFMKNEAKNINFLMDISEKKIKTPFDNGLDIEEYVKKFY